VPLPETVTQKSSRIGKRRSPPTDITGRRLRLLEDLVGLHLETVLTVSRIDVNSRDIDDGLPVIPTQRVSSQPRVGID